MTINDEVNTTLKQIYDDPEVIRANRSILYLLGKNKKGVGTTLISLKRTFGYGCRYCPAIPPKEIAKAMFLLFKKGLSVAGFVLIDRCDGDSALWGSARGTDLYRLNLPFLTYKNYTLHSYQYEKGRDLVITPVWVAPKKTRKRVTKA